MQCVETITGCQRRGAQGGSDGLIALFKGELEGGQMPQRGTVVRFDACGAREIFDGILVQAGRLEKTSRMKSEFKRIRIEVARRPTVERRAIDLSRDGERAARMAMPLGPLRTKFQQSLVCRRGFDVSVAIAEYPGAEIRCIFFCRPQVESHAGAFDCIFSTPPMQQCLAQSTVE